MRDVLHNGDFDFYPKKGFRRCRDMGRLIRRIIADYDIEILIYKGGNVERDFAIELGILSKCLEDFGVKKVNSHEPLEEIQDHLRQLKEIASRERSYFDLPQDKACSRFFFDYGLKRY